MSRVIAQVTLNRDSGLPEDQIVNTFHFEDDNAESAAATGNVPGLVSRLVAFYQAIGPHLSVVLSGAGKVQVYDWAHAKPRVPINITPFTFTTAAGGLPSEVALCLSMRGLMEAGANRARRRGRVFLGPLGLNLAGSVTGNASDSRPNDNDTIAIVTAARTMATGGAGAFRLCVYSPTTFATTQDENAAWNDVVELWADNAFDTIRSRGARPTKRITTQIGSSTAPVVSNA